jgi:hypothetical protein
MNAHALRTVRTPVAAAPSGVLRRQCACGQHMLGGMCTACRRNSAAWQRSGSDAQRSAGAFDRAWHTDLSGRPTRAASPAAQIADDALGEPAVSSNGPAPEPAGSTAASSAGPGGQAEGAQAVDAEGAAGAQPLQTATKKGKVTALDVITGSSGALTGFPPIPGGGNLNTPGPFNDITTTGSCKNVHQMKFTLAGTTSSEVSLVRTINRTASAAGVQQTHNGSDGPSAATVIRPTTDVIAVADSPGYSGQGLSAPFPVTYNAAFVLHAFDAIQKGIYAMLTYNVAVSKQTMTDPKPTNQITNIVKAIY